MNKTFFTLKEFEEFFRKENEMNDRFISESLEKELLEEFDIKKVHAIMVLMDFKWQPKGKTPSKKEIKNHIKDMIKRMNTTKSEYISSCGLNLYFFHHNEDPFFELTFTPVSSIAFINNEV